MPKFCVEFEPGNGGEPTESFRTYTATVGDGSSLTYNLTHGLGTSDVFYSLRNVATGELDGYDVQVSSQENSVQLTFATPPAPNSVRVLVGALEM
jgi:hypothetical protein